MLDDDCLLLDVFDFLELSLLQHSLKNEIDSVICEEQ